MTVDAFLVYLMRCLQLTGEQLLWLLGPLLLFALCMHGLSRLVRNRSAQLFGHAPFVWLTFPGTVAHELGHAVFCVVFGHRIIDLALFRPGSDGVLGYVKHSWNRKSVYQVVGNFFIGTGPIWFGTLVIGICAFYLPGPAVFEPLWRIPFPLFAQGGATPPLTVAAMLGDPLLATLGRLFSAEHLGDWRLWLFVYLVFAIGSHVTLSPSDLKGSLSGLCAGILLLLLANLATLWLKIDPAIFLHPLAPHVLTVAGLLLLVLACNLGAALLVLLLSASTRR